MKKILFVLLLLSSFSAYSLGNISRGANSLTINAGFKVNPIYYGVKGCITQDHGITNYCTTEQIDAVGNSFFRFFNSNIPSEGKFEFYISKNNGVIISYQAPSNFTYGRGATISKSGAKFLYGQVPYITYLGNNVVKIDFGYYGLSLISGDISVQNQPELINGFVYMIPSGYGLDIIYSYYHDAHTAYFNIPANTSGFFSADVEGNNGWYYYKFFGGYGVAWDIYGFIPASNNSFVYHL